MLQAVYNMSHAKRMDVLGRKIARNGRMLARVELLPCTDRRGRGTDGATMWLKDEPHTVYGGLS